MIISALTLLMGLPLVLKGNMGTAHTSGMWLYFQMYSMRMSLALALCNPRRHAPIMKRYMQAGIMIASVKHMWLGEESLPLQCVRSHWGKKKKKTVFASLKKCHIVMMCFYVTLFILTASLSSRPPKRKVVVTVFSRTKRLLSEWSNIPPGYNFQFSTSVFFSSVLDDFLYPYLTEHINTAMKTWLQYSQSVISKIKSAICKNWSLVKLILQKQQEAANH